MSATLPVAAPRHVLVFSGHRVDAPATLSTLKPDAVIITNPSYRTEIGEHLSRLGVDAQLLVA